MELNGKQVNPELQMLLNNKENGIKYKERRIPQIRENYELYRGHVPYNRITQRQTVNVPLMKTVLRTVLKDIDDMPIIVFKELSNDKEAEIFLNEYWKRVLDKNNAELQDIVDKKQDFFSGRTFDSWQIVDGEVVFDIEDPEDILVDRFVNPYNIDSSNFLIHLHIFVTLDSLVKNDEYDKNQIKNLIEFFKTEQGIIKANDNFNTLQEKNRKLANLGVTDIDDPILGMTYVELTYHYVLRPEGEEWIDYESGKVYKEEDEQIFVYIEAENSKILCKKPQEKIIGITKDHFWRKHYRYNSWGDDIDNQDFWTDGIADIVRVPNQILNTFFSQEVERRTLSNLGMHFYDASLRDNGFAPNTWEVKGWGWYPIPVPTGKKLSDVFQKIELRGEPGNLEFNDFISNLVEKATGATSTQQGIVTPSQRTLGEVQIAQAQAKARVQSLGKFYTHCWKKRAEKFLKLIEAGKNKLNIVRIYTEGKNSSDIFTREISPNDYLTKSGYRVQIWSQEEKKANDLDSLNKINQARLQMPNNPKLAAIANRKALELADLKPDEVKLIMDWEENQIISSENQASLPLTNPINGSSPNRQLAQSKI